MTDTIDFVDVYDFLVKNDVEEPVTVLKHGTPHAVMIPFALFEALRNSNRKAIHVSDLSKEDLDIILNAEIPEECRAFDGEMKK